MSSIAARLIKGSLWISLSRLIVNALGTLSTIVMAWYLSPSDFGVVALATSMLMIVNTVTDISLAQALIRHKDPQASHFDAAWTLGVSRGLLLCLVFALGAEPIAFAFHEPRLSGVMTALGFSLLLTGLLNPRLIVFQRQLIFSQEFLLNVSQKAAGLMAALAVAITYHSYWALVTGTLVAQATRVIVSYWIIPYRPRVTFQHIREFFGFSAWITAGQIVNTLNWRFDHLMIGKLLGGTPLGYYTFGDELAKLPTAELTTPLTQTVYPSFSAIRDNPARLAAAYQRVQTLVTAIALPAGIGVAVIAEPLVRLVLGEKWLPVIFIIQGLAAIYAVQTLGSLVQPLGMATGHTKMLFWRSTQMFFLRVPIIFAGLFFFGLKGAVLCRIFTGLFAAVVNMILVRRIIGVTVVRQVSANMRALASAAVMGGAVTLASSQINFAHDKLALASQLGGLIALGALVYCSSTLALWWSMKKPSGPEMEIQVVFGKLLAKVRPV